MTSTCLCRWCGKAVLPPQRNDWVWRSPGSAVRFANSKSGWAFSFWCAPPPVVAHQAGEQLYHNVESGFDALDMGLATLAHYRQTPSGTVRINASQHAIDKVLLPKLAIFKQRYPDIRWN